MSRRSARTIRNFSLELPPNLVLQNLKKSTFQHLTANWKVTYRMVSKASLWTPSSRTKASIFDTYIPATTSKTQNQILVSHKTSCIFRRRNNETISFPKKTDRVSVSPYQTNAFPANDTTNKQMLKLGKPSRFVKMASFLMPL